MDAYQIYCRYKQDPNWNPPKSMLDKIKDEKVLKLISKIIQERSMEHIESKMASASIGTPRRPPKNSVTVEEEPQAQLISATQMSQKSMRRLMSLMKCLQVDVPMDWVRIFSSKAIGTSQPEKFKTLRDSDSHVHIVNNSVVDFILSLDSAPEDTITTWSWTDGSARAWHIQNLRKKLREMFPNVQPGVALIFLGSVGLPCHELFKPSTFIQDFKRSHFKMLTNESVIKTTLKKILKIETIHAKTEANQLLQQYAEHQTLLDTLDKTPSVDQYMFKHYYSWPTPDTLKHIIDEAINLLDLWRLTKH